MLKKIYSVLLSMFLFFLPWQTRYIWHYGEINNGYWEYGTFSIYGTEILLWLILALFIFRRFFQKDLQLKLSGNLNLKSLLLVFFLISLGVAAVLSKNFWVSYYFIFRLLEALALMTIFLWEKDKLKYHLALWAGGAIQGILAIWQFLTQHVFASKWLGMAEQKAGDLGPSVIEFADQRWLRAYGSFGSPNSLGIYLAVLFVLGLILYIKTESAKIKIIISVGQLFIISGLLLSFSRNSWLAAILGTASLLVIIFYKQKQFLFSFFKQICFALAVAIFWLIIFYPVFTARFNLSNRLEVKSISERKGQYAEALSFIKSNPIFGIGPGVYTFALSQKYQTLPSWQYQPIHNIYLLALVEAGFLSALFLFFIFKRLFFIILKSNLMHVPLVVTLFLAGIFDHWLWSMYTGILLWWVVFALSVDKINNPEELKE